MFHAGLFRRASLEIVTICLSGQQSSKDLSILSAKFRGNEWHDNKDSGMEGYGLFFGKVEPRVGVEPTTCRLRIGCSTTELPRPLIINDLFLRQETFHRIFIVLY